MKKFDRLPPQQRKEEICAAALALFHEKGFAATTMENIVQRVTLSKGGVYRLYPSTAAILADLMIEGMHLRNAYYESRVKAEIAQGKPLNLPMLVDMIIESLLLYPDFSEVYVEFLWEKRRNPELETLYQQICAESVADTTSLICKYGADQILPVNSETLMTVTELMNAAILSMHILKLQNFFTSNKTAISEVLTQLLMRQLIPQ